jgi:hypothetical protein
MSYNHLTFLSHGESRIGGVNMSYEIDNSAEEDRRPPEQLFVDVVEYLKQLKHDKKASVSDILNTCKVDLEGKHYQVLDGLKRNSKIDISEENGIMKFKYRAKFDIR